MGVIKLEGKIYYAKLMDVSGRPWWVSLHTRSFEVACKKYEKLTRLQRALRATLQSAEKSPVCAKNKACTEIGADLGDLMPKNRPL